MTNYWERKSLLSRIASPIHHDRHEAGSPNAAEINVYKRYLVESMGDVRIDPRDAHVVILGMTPELRCCALELGCRVTTIDNNPEAIDLYREWVPTRLRVRESILQSDWSDVAQAINSPIHAILGDGVLANTSSASSCQDLLRIFSKLLSPYGRCIFRLTYLPDGYLDRPQLSQHFLAMFRQGMLGPEEFGFGIRKLGFLDEAYDPASHILDNSIVYHRIAEMYEKGVMSNAEFAAAHNYYFTGPNLFLPEQLLSKTISDSGFQVSRHLLSGRDWYRYYSFFVCTSLWGVHRSTLTV